MKSLVGALVALGMMACSSSDDDGGSSGATPEKGSGCADITGNYDVKVTPVSGDCPPGDGKNVTVTITTVNGKLNVAVPGVEGGCPADLNTSTCRFTALCKVVSNGQNVALFNYDYTFSGTSFQGSVTGSLSPPIQDPACQATAKHAGTRI